MRIVATLGPASSTDEGARALREAGADEARLNASHLAADELRAHVDLALSAGFGPGEIVVDLQGGKTRLGVVDPPRDVDVGDEVILEAGRGESGVEDVLVVDRPEFLVRLEPGDRIRIDEGRVALRVVETLGSRVRLRAERRGRLASRKGIARLGGTPADADRLLERDLELMDVALAAGVRCFAVSYAGGEQILRHARAAAGAAGSDVTLVAKLEHPRAIACIAELARSADELWICRGDLGAECGLERLAAEQAKALAFIGADAPPLLVAGQVLHHMTVSPRPTRAEVCQISELAWRGVAGFVLSDETAVGPHGPEAVRWLRSLLSAARDRPS